MSINILLERGYIMNQKWVLKNGLSSRNRRPQQLNLALRQIADTLTERASGNYSSGLLADYGQSKIYPLKISLLPNSIRL